MKKELLLINSTPVLLILLVFFYNTQPLSLSASSIQEMKQEQAPQENTPKENTVSISNGIDVENADVGTLTLTLSMPQDKFKDADKVVFFESKLIEGLKIIYNVKDGYLEGGVPWMQSSKVTLFDARRHIIVYSYDKNSNGQAFSVDGNPVAIGSYAGKKAERNSITAAFIGSREPFLLDGIEAKYYER